MGALASLIRLAPVVSLLVGILGSGLLSAGGVWAVKDFWFTHITEPQIRHEQRAADEAEFTGMVEKAKAEYAIKLAKITEALGMAAEQQRLEDEAWHDAQIKLYEDQIHDYEQELQLEGRSCRLTPRDLEFLGGLVGLRPQPGAVGRGAGQGEG